MTALHITKLENRAVLELTGADVFDFLQNLISNDMQDASETHAIYAALLTAQGKFLHDFIVVQRGDAYLLDCVAARKDDLVRRLTMYKLRADVTLTATGGFDVYGLYGDGAIDAASLPHAPGAMRTEKDQIMLVDPRLAHIGVRIVSSDVPSVTGATTAPFMDYEAHRLALGVPEGGVDIVPEKNFLLEANFEELNGVSFTKGCYVGQELTARTKHRAKIKKRLYNFTSETPVHSGESFTLGGKEIAEVRSVNATGTGGLALARIETLADAKPAEIEPAGVVLYPPDYLSSAKAES